MNKRSKECTIEHYETTITVEISRMGYLLEMYSQVYRVAIDLFFKENLPFMTFRFTRTLNLGYKISDFLIDRLLNPDMVVVHN